MRHAAKNRWFSVQNHLFFIPFFTHKELCELPMKSAFRQNAEAQKFVQQKTTLAAAGQRLYNQTKNRKEGFQVNIKIIQRQCGGTEFLSQPHRLHLGAQNAAGVDELCFTLPEAWAGCTVALYLRRSDGTLLAPVSLDTQHCVTVDRRLTGSTGGQWMLAAIDASGYAAYTRPGSYDTYAILPIDGGAEELPPSQYEQFVARVLESASTASTAAQRAAASAASTASNAAQAQTAAQRTSADSAAASRCAARAEAAAARAEELVPTGGQVVSVNGKSGVVVLRAQDVGALPRPAQPAAGSLLRVLSVNPDTGALLTDTTPPPDLTPYVRSSTLPDAKTPGPVRIDPQYGVAVREDATLTLVPASAEQLDSMTDGFAPLTPALLPYGVKKALTTASTAAGWTGAEKTAALRTLGADLTAYYTRLEADAKFGTPYTLPPATADQLGGVKVGDYLDIAADGTLSGKTLYDTIAASVAVKSEARLVWNTHVTSPNKFTTWDVQIPDNVDKICITKGRSSSSGNNTEKSIARGGTTTYDCNYDFTITFQTNGILHVANSYKTLYPLELWIDGYHYPTLADLLTQVTAVESSVTDLQVALCELYEEKEEN